MARHDNLGKYAIKGGISWRGARPTHVCLICSKDFKIKSKKTNLYCSLPCYWISKKGKSGYWLGKKRGVSPKKGRKFKPHSKEARERMSLAKKGKRPHNKYKKGEEHYSYIKDRSKLVKSEKKHHDSNYREWMKGVKNRDGWKCKLLNSDCKGRLESHHIFNWKEYPELRYIKTNGITLCAYHHPRGRDEEKRMIPTLQELLTVSKE